MHECAFIFYTWNVGCRMDSSGRRIDGEFKPLRIKYILLICTVMLPQVKPKTMVLEWCEFLLFRTHGVWLMSAYNCWIILLVKYLVIFETDYTPSPSFNRLPRPADWLLSNKIIRFFWFHPRINENKPPMWYYNTI